MFVESCWLFQFLYQQCDWYRTLWQINLSTNLFLVTSSLTITLYSGNNKLPGDLVGYLSSQRSYFTSRLLQSNQRPFFRLLSLSSNIELYLWSNCQSVLRTMTLPPLQTFQVTKKSSLTSFFIIQDRKTLLSLKYLHSILITINYLIVYNKACLVC